ncbi:MAG: oligosaccharide flippase family protein [Desulfobacteraceae bacterium]|nr:oligosaccharide flippase family protein [Desulfobacteraceae bacterium]
MESASHIKNTFKHALIFGGAGLIGKVIGFIMLPIYAYHLRAEGYGVIGMIDTVLSLLTLLIGYGITGAMNRFYFETYDTQKRKRIVSTTIILMFFVVLIVCSPVLLLSKQVAWLAFGNKEWGNYIILAVVAFMGTMTSKTAENYILIKQQSFILSLISLIRLVFQLSLNIYFIVVLQMGVLGYLYASIIDAVLYTLFMHTNALLRVGFSFEKNIARNVLAFSLPLLPGYVAMFIRSNLDRIILRTYLGLTTVGIFEMLFKFATLLSFFVVQPFSKIWQVKRFEVCDLEDGPSILSRVFTYHLAIMFFIGLLFSLEIPVILKLLTPKEFWLSGFIIYFAVISRVFNGAYYHFFFGLLYAKKTWKISVIQWVTAIGSLIITYPMILLFNLYGAVVASMLCGILQCVLGYFMARSYYVIPFAWGALCRMAIMMTGLYWVAKDFSITKLPAAGWLDLYVAPIIRQILVFLSLDQVKNGKLLNYLVDGLPHLIDGIILACYSCSFIFGLVFLKIIPPDVVKSLFSIKILRKPMKIFPQMANKT